MKTEILFKKKVKTENKTMKLSYLLSYGMTEEFPGVMQYGITVEDKLTGERSSVPFISVNREEIVTLIKKIYDLDVTPQSLLDIVLDYIAERTSNV